MRVFKYFFNCFFNSSPTFMELDQCIDDFEYFQGPKEKENFLQELDKIIKSCSYKLASEYILKYGRRKLSPLLTEELVRYLYARLKNKKPRLTLEELFKIR
jgi:hypothetical protein